MLEQADLSGLSSALVGRSHELRVLTRQAEAARSGRAGLVILSGPAGIGKTSLLQTFLNSDTCRDMTVLNGSCGEVVAGTGYGGVRELFGSLGLSGADARSSPLLRGPARRALPALTSGQIDQENPSASAAYPALHGLYWLAANLMVDRPLVLVLDDVHWCDERSLAWVDFLLRRAEDLPLLVVLAHRSEAEPVAPSVLADIAAQRSPTMVRLAPLTRAAVGQLARQVFRTPVASAFADRAATVSGGNPLRLSRLLGELRARGVRPDEEGVRRVAEVGASVIASSVIALLDSLPLWVREVARAIAVLGEETPELVGMLAEVPPARVAQGIAVLRRAEVLAADRADLAHDVIRASALEPVGAEALAELRTRAALLLSDAGRPAEEVAGRLMLLPALTQPWMPAVLREAAAQAEGRGAPEAAVRYLHRVLEAEPDSVPVRIQLAASLAETNPPDAIRVLEEALGLADDVRTRAMAAVRYGMVCLAVQRSPEGVRVLEAVLAELEAELGPCPDPSDRELHTLVESTLLIVGSDEKSTVAATLDRAALLTAPPGDTPAQRQMLAMMTVLSAMDGRSAEQTVEQARRALTSPGGEPEAWSSLASSFALSLADEVEGSLGALDRTLERSQENAAVWTFVLALSTRALVLHGAGAFPDALADAQTAFEIVGAEKWGSGSALPQITFATLLVERGEAEQAETVFRAIRRSGLERYVLQYHLSLMARARARWAVGDWDAALALYLECGRSLDESRFSNPVFAPWWSEAACLLAVMNRGGEAGEMTEYGTELAQRWGTPRALGLAALARGAITPGAAGIETLTEAVAALADSPARADHAKAEFILGRALLKTGDHRGAREHLRTATDLAQRCGALALGGAARRLLVTAGGRMRKMSASPLDMLTGMERRVAGLAAAGASNRAIAEALFVTVRTIETHLTGVYRKLGVSGRTELGAALCTPDIPEGPRPGRESESRWRR
ncbi:helix-turn-helix transcriptional regulator [Streptomyces fulvorobeus]|uniref:ATP/maltotriose-dependent transcriptional regulator MalT n=1 Tax=Streptomyces fulvorobeus TaxID=284028 RepID=A0A7Y9HHM6_9ACTN|nr:AAA family ATPase [Streptomyces fulvorobeus]NYE44734.1 ATP/maltotriose-dependent transcriptional regulator MalT [Streptomyces fulvorobeus]